MIHSREKEGFGEYREKKVNLSNFISQTVVFPKEKKLIPFIGYFRTFKEYL